MEKMKAIVHTKYGEPDELQLKEVEKPVPKDKVIDYTKEDFTKSDERYDFVFDVVGKTTFSQCKGILRQKGIYLENMLELTDILKMMWTSIIGGKRIMGGYQKKVLKILIS